MKGKKCVFPLALGFAILLAGRFVSAGSVAAAFFTVLMPVPFLFTVRHAATRKGAFLATVVFSLGSAVMQIGYTPSWLLDIAVFFTSGLFISLAFWADRCYGAGRGFWGTLIFPAVWVALFCLSGQVRLGFQYRLDAFATAFRVPDQMMSVIGSAGCLFLLLWASSVIAYVWGCVSLKREKVSRKGLAVWAMIIAAVFLFGTLYYKPQAAAGKSVRTAMAVGPYMGDYDNAEPLRYEEYIALLENSAKQAAEAGAELLMFHEEAFLLVGAEQEADFKARSAAVAGQYGLNILLGEEVWNTDECPEGKGINRIRWVTPEGGELFTYAKHSVIPVIEAPEYVRGEAGIPVVEVPFACGKVKVAAVISYDSNFSSYISQIPADTELLLIPSWDWQCVTVFHREVARELAIENGVTVVKNTYDGIGIVINPAGNTLYEHTAEEAGFDSVTVTDVPIAGRKTVYNAIGPYSAQAFTAIVTGTVIVLERAERKKRKGGSQICR